MLFYKITEAGIKEPKEKPFSPPLNCYKIKLEKRSFSTKVC